MSMRRDRPFFDVLLQNLVIEEGAKTVYRQAFLNGKASDQR
jgi:hypothetical protein